ncbi:MAG: T9SS type A sorting domain-containing protein [Bacteroidales bacterium]|nr:T9SS type A sorting domain-containing protein [Bacteroidales bacterium]
MMKIFTFILLFLIGIVSLNAQTVFTEDFEGGALPAGWTIETQATDGGWLFGTASALSSQYFTIGPHTKIAATNDDGCNCNKMNDKLITPVIDLSSYTGLFMSFDKYFWEASYSGDTEIATIEASIDGGTTWTVVKQLTGDDSWRNVAVDVSPYAGNANVKFAFHYSDQGGWLYGCAIDNVEIFVPPYIYDMAAKSISTMPIVGLNNAPFTIEGTIENYGSSTITSFDLNYKIDNGAAVTVAVTGVNIVPLDVYSFSHATLWDPATVGIYDVTVWASNLNGSTDENPSNDEFTKTIEVIANFIEKKLLHEVFTSSTCGPCVGGNQNITAVLDANPEKWTCVKYQMSWPSPGDPYYTAEGGVRRTYYGVSGVPNMALNGGWDGNPNGYDQAIFDQYYNEPAFMEISAVHDINGQDIQVEVNVTPLADFPAGLKLHIAVVENMTTGNVGNNGETEFHFVMMKMVPDASGTDVGPLTNGTPVSYTKTASLAGTFIEEMTDLSVVVFVQTDASKEVHQSTWSIEGIGIEENKTEIITGIYPNPANSTTWINYELRESSSISIDIYNMTGEFVFSSDQGNQPAGNHKVQIDTKDFANGIYTLQLRVNESAITRKLVISK